MHHVFIDGRAQVCGVGFRAEENDMCISLLGGRLMLKADGPSYSGFGCRVEPDDDCCIPPPSVTPNPPVNHVETGCDSPWKLCVDAPRGDASSENAVDTVQEFSRNMMAVDSSSTVDF